MVETAAHCSRVEAREAVVRSSNRDSAEWDCGQNVEDDENAEDADADEDAEAGGDSEDSEDGGDAEDAEDDGDNEDTKAGIHFGCNLDDFNIRFAILSHADIRILGFRRLSRCIGSWNHAIARSHVK